MRNLLLLATLAAATPVAAQTPAAGAKLFASKCGVCHYAPDKPDEQPRMGPSMKGIVGRKAGSLASFTRYSKAMKAYGKPWNEAALDRFIANPRTEVPGTNMAFVGLKNPGERAAIVAYLKAAAKPAR